MMSADGVIAAYGIGEDYMPIFTDDGIDNLRELVRIYKDNDGLQPGNQESENAGC
jgi:hypothetical protein